MTSTGKIFVGILILTAAFITAKFLHQLPTPIPVEDDRHPQTAKLHWQAVPLVDTNTSNLTAVASNTADDVQFARLATAIENVAPPAPIDLSRKLSEAASPTPPTLVVSQRMPLPFVVSGSTAPESKLLAVDDEEESAAAAANDFVQHTVQFGETLPQIAQQYTGRRESYMTIYQANLDVLSSPAEVTPGIVLKIPVR